MVADYFCLHRLEVVAVASERTQQASEGLWMQGYTISLG